MMAVYKEARRLDVELFAHVFADLDQFFSAGAALARSQFMAVLDARQVGRQRLATGMAALTLVHLWRRRQLGLDCRQVGADRFFKQLTLLAVESFALFAKLDAPVVGQLQGQRGNLEVFLR